MGSLIFLRLGQLEIAAAKNGIGFGFQPLFQEQDLCQSDYVYVDDVVEQKEAYCRPLAETMTRLNLLGYSLDHIHDRYQHDHLLQRDTWREAPAVFDVLVGAFRSIDGRTCAHWYSESDENHPWMRVARHIVAELLPDADGEEARRAAITHFHDIEALHPLVHLRLLAENPNNREAQIIWEFADVVENGWVDFDDVRAGPRRSDRFLVVTEGSSDSAVIERALTVLRPDVRDFFDFIDMDSNYPLTGIGNLHNFYLGLLKINILNKILVIYDNDTEGSSKFAEAAQLEPLPNVRIMKLPDLEAFRAFLTTGPTGQQTADINGKAVSIECFLDLSWAAAVPPQVRWTGYHHRAGQYQGELVGKEVYVRRFLALPGMEANYDYTTMNILLDRILQECTIMAGNSNGGEP